MIKPLFTVYWQRANYPEDGELCCHGLTYKQLVRRLRGAIKNSGPILVLAVEREPLTEKVADRNG